MRESQHINEGELEEGEEDDKEDDEHNKEGEEEDVCYGILLAAALRFRCAEVVLLLLPPLLSPLFFVNSKTCRYHAHVYV